MADKPERKRMSVREFSETGLLFEINRRILHPLGLALEITRDPSDPYGPMEFSGIWDCRDDPEGILFEPKTFEWAAERFEVYLKEHGDEATKLRAEKLGFVVQSKPEQGERVFTHPRAERAAKEMEELVLKTLGKEDDGDAGL